MDLSNARTPRNIVLADSRPDSVDFICKLLEAYGHRVFTARDGPEALRRTQYFTPDAMIVDLELPALDGFEVAQAIRSQTRFDQTILIASTTDLTRSHLGRADEHGFDYYVPKPAEPMLLHEALYSPRQQRMVLLSMQMLKQSRQLLKSMRPALQENRELRARSRRLLELVFLLQKKCE
jgi:CheY-like chemotaxis protein